MRSRLSAALIGIAALLWSAAALAACPAWMTLSGATCQSETFPASGIIVGTTDTQTLSGKTLTAPVISSITNTGTLTLPTTTGTLLDSALNLSDLGSAATARTNLGLGAAALLAVPIPAASGGTGVNNGSNTLTLGGALTTTGAGAVTFALPATAATFTFPGASQTLASLAGTETLTNKTLTAPTINGGALSGTLSGSPTFSGDPLFSGLTTGTQVSCLGLTVGNALTLSTGACGSGGGSTTITLGPGLSNSATVYNPGTQTVTNGSTIYLQLQYLGVTASCTVNTTCAGGVASDAGYLLTPTAASLTLTMPNPASGLATQVFGYDGAHSYTLTTTGGTATIYGCGPTGTSITVSYPVGLISDGTNYQCVPNAPPLGNSGVTAGPYTNANITVNAQGIVTAASNGTGGSGGLSITPIAGLWYFPYLNSGMTTGAAAPSGNIYCTPGVLLGPVHLESLGAYITTAGSGNVQLAIYNVGSWGYPSTLVASTASLADNGTAPDVVSGAITTGALAAGEYFFCRQNSDSTVVMDTLTGVSGAPSALYGQPYNTSMFIAPNLGYSTTEATYGTWPTFTNATSWTINNQGTAIEVQVSSSP